jgi:hypothetical protein
MYTYLESDEMKDKFWKLPTPEVYFTHLTAPSKPPTEAAMLVAGAWCGSSLPECRSLIMVVG